MIYNQRANAFGESDGLRRMRFGGRMFKRRNFPPLTGETPPIIAQDTRKHERQLPMEGTDTQSPPIIAHQPKQGLGGRLGSYSDDATQSKWMNALGTAADEFDTDQMQFLEPMQMQQPQGQIFAPQAPSLWAGTIPRTPFRRY